MKTFEEYLQECKKLSIEELKRRLIDGGCKL